MAKAIRITSKNEGFRRGGIAHPAKATDYPLDFFNEDQARAISEEPMLTVELVDVSDEELLQAHEPELLLSLLGSDLLNLPLGNGVIIQLGELIILAADGGDYSLPDWNKLTPEERAFWMQPVLDDLVEAQRVLTEKAHTAIAADAGASSGAGAPLVPAPEAAPPPPSPPTEETAAAKKARLKKEAAEQADAKK